MRKTILQQLFYGEIFPGENINPNATNPESRELNNIISDEMDYFSNILSEADKKRFQKLNDLNNFSSSLYDCNCFTYGFRLGASLLIEILQTSD